METSRTIRAILWMSVVMCFCCVSSRAQLPVATLNGVVTDPSGAAVAGAKVTLTQTTTGLKGETKTGPGGLYVFTNLAPGVYALRVESSGFTSQEFKDIQLEVGRTTTIDVQLRIPQVGTQIIVTEAAEGVDLTQSEVQGVVTSQTIQVLPLNGRNFLELAFLIPGNRPAPRFDPTKTNTLEVSSAGAFGRGGNIIVDGVDNNDEVVGGTLSNFPQDGVGEFQIAVNKFTAEVGRSSSSIINIVTKSGTNDVHGSEFFYFRHKSLQGLPATFDRREPTPRFAREQFGGSLGGPIVHDKLFGFISLEYLNQDHAVPVDVRDFTTNSLRGSSALAFVHDVRIVTKEDWKPTEKDTFSVRYSFNRSVDIDNGFLADATGAAANRQQSLNRYNSLLASWSRILSPHQVNSLIFHANYFINSIPAFSPNDPATNPAGLAAGNEIRFTSELQDGANYRIPQRTRLNRYQVRDTFNWSLSRHTLRFGIEYQHYGSDVLFDLFGSGSIFTAQNFATQDLNNDGVIDDRDIPLAFALKSAAPVRPPVAPTSHNNYLGLFVQDDWRFSSRLTFNLGLRWDGDFNSLGETDQNNACPNLTTIILNCEFIRNILGPHDSSAKYKNFGPRLGFAWDPFGHGDTVVRGGYGIYYDRVILEVPILETLLNGRILPINAFNGSTCSNINPITKDCKLPGAKFDVGTPALGVGGAGGGTIATVGPFAGGFAPFGIGINVVDNRAATPYVQQFTLGVQHQFGKDYILSVDGLHDFGTRILIPRLLRSLPKGVTSPFVDCPNGRDPCNVVDPASGQSVASCSTKTPGSTCQQITDIESAAKTWYDAMLLTFEKRPGRGPWRPGFHLSYTLSKTFDEQQDDQVSPSGAPTEDPAILAEHVNNLRIEKGYSVGDQRHRFVGYATMELPWKIEFSPIWTWASHVPMDSFVGTLGGRLPNIPRNALGREISDGAALNAAITAYNALPACLPNGNTAGPVPCNKGATLPLVNPRLKFGDDFNSFDMALSRTFHFNERHSLEFRTDMFNLFNVTNILGVTNRNYSGFANTIDAPPAPGQKFGNFNQPLDTAGKFFGSGGPRAFQFSLRYSF